MSYRLRCDLSGWGAVRNPLDADEEIPVEGGVVTVDDARLADALEREYGPLSRVDDDDAETDANGGDDEADESPTCAGNDGECSREVDEAGDYCWQHQED